MAHRTRSVNTKKTKKTAEAARRRAPVKAGARALRRTSKPPRARATRRPAPLPPLFQVSICRVVSAPVAEVADAIVNPTRRAQWLEEAAPELRRALNDAFEAERPQVAGDRREDARLRYRWGRGTVEIRIVAEPQGGASIVAENTELPDGCLVDLRRAQWHVALDGLSRHLRA
jgi:hypothetical protein